MNYARQLTIEGLAVVVLFILLFIMAVRVPLDTDVWWHLRSGEYLLDDRSILREDIFSHTFNGKEWINHSWGSQVILALAYRLTGGDNDISGSGTIGLALYTAILGTAGMGFVYRMCAGNAYSRAFVMVFGAATAAVFWSARPQMVSFLLSTIALYLLYLFKREKRDYLWLMPVLMVVWVNLHAGYIIAFIFLLGFMAGEVVGAILNPADSIGWRGLRKVFIVTVVSVLALSINPFGPRMILYPFETAGLQTLNLFITEWQSPDFKNPQTWAFIALLFAIIAFASQTTYRVDWSDLSLILGTALLALWAGRNIAMFAVVATPVLSRLVDAFLTERGWQIRPMKTVRGVRLLLNWIFLFVILLGGLAKIAADLLPENVEEIQSEFLPLDALDYLKNNPPKGNLFNNYNWGGLIIYTLPDVPVFVDGRTDLYGDDFLKKYFRSSLGASDWREPFEEFDIQSAFLEKESALTTLLREDENWQVVYEDEQSVILEREIGADDASE